MRKATWLATWVAGENSVTRTMGLHRAPLIRADLEVTYPRTATDRPFALHLTPEDATYLAHRLLFHVEQIEKEAVEPVTLPKGKEAAWVENYVARYGSTEEVARAAYYGAVREAAQRGAESAARVEAKRREGRA